MAKTLICPHCNKITFDPEHIWDGATRLKCDECGGWSNAAEWKTVAQLREEVERLKAENAGLLAGIIDQARSLSAMIDPVMGDMYCRGWRRALDTLEKSITHGKPKAAEAVRL